jgi:hypothetical protein
MTSVRQWQANRNNARKSTGPTTEEGKKHSRCNAVRHGLTAETVAGGLEDAEDYSAFEAAIIADYDAQSAVERELVLRLASLLWRLRRATATEAGLFEIQGNGSGEFRPPRYMHAASREIVNAMFGKVEAADINSHPANRSAHEPSVLSESRSGHGDPDCNVAANLADRFLRLANLPSFALDRLSRYEVTLWRQVHQILFALDGLDRRKPQERTRRFFVAGHLEPGVTGFE